MISLWQRKWPLGWLLVTTLLLSTNLYSQNGFKNAARTYRLTQDRVLTFALVSVPSAADGALEGYLFDGRKSFERKFGVRSSSWLGSESWRSVYRFGDPAQGFKSPVHNWAGSLDFYHLADDVRKYGYISAGIKIGVGSKKQSRWHTAMDVGIGLVISASVKGASMWWVRN